MIRSIISFRFLFLAFLLLGFSACVDHEFDEPPVGDLTDLAANATIDDLKALHTLGADPTLVRETMLIEGVVSADDEFGNLFRQIAIQDASGGLILRLNATGLFNDFPVGTKLVINCEGLYIGDFNNLYQLNGSPDSGIEENLIDQHVFVTERGLTVEPTVVSIDALQNSTTFDNLLATLIKFDNVQFIDASTEVPYADVVNRFSVNLNLEDCEGNEIIVRTSGYSDFASALSPSGNGSLTALLTVFGNTQQLILRSLDDVQMTGDRCGGGGGNTGGELMNISDLRAEFTGTNTAGPDGKKIQGVVISDGPSGNWTGRNVVIQDATAGIVVRFSDNHNFTLGDEITVNVSGRELSEFSGLLQVNEVPLSNAAIVGPGTLPTPRVTTISEYLANAEAWESTLVRFNGVSLSGRPTYDGSVTVTDASGNVPLFTRTSASFSGTALPTGALDLVAVASQFNDPQLIIRNLDDVIGGGNTGGGTDPVMTSTLDLREAFANGATAAPAAKKIKGIVISDRDSENITGKNLVLQDDKGGIVVRFIDNHNFTLGEELEINVSNQELSEFNGLLQVNNVPNNLANSFGNGVLPAAREATIEDVLNNMKGDQSWESTLVLIKDVTFEGGGTYSGSKTLKDATGTIAAFTRSQANFANSNVPTAKAKVTAIVSEFNDPQLNLRNVKDVVAE